MYKSSGLRIVCICFHQLAAESSVVSCGQHFEREERTLSSGTFRYPENRGTAYENCLRKSWLLSHERRFAGRVRTRR